MSDSEAKRRNEARSCRGGRDLDEGRRPEYPPGPDATLRCCPTYKFIVERRDCDHDVGDEGRPLSHSPPPCRSVAARVSGADAAAATEGHSFTIGAQRGAALSWSQQFEDASTMHLVGVDSTRTRREVGRSAEDLNNEERSISPISSDIGDAMQCLLAEDDRQKQNSPVNVEFRTSNTPLQATSDAATILMQLGRGAPLLSAVRNRSEGCQTPFTSTDRMVGIQASRTYEPALNAPDSADRVGAQPNGILRSSPRDAEFSERGSSRLVGDKAHAESFLEINRANRDDLYRRTSGYAEIVNHGATRDAQAMNVHFSRSHEVDQSGRYTAFSVVGRASSVSVNNNVLVSTCIRAATSQSRATTIAESPADVRNPSARQRSIVPGGNEDGDERCDVVQVPARQPSIFHRTSTAI